MGRSILPGMAILLFSNTVFAVDGDDLLHSTAHFGATYVITDVTEVICRKLAGKEHKTICTIVGAGTASAINVAYKARQGFPSDTKRALLSGFAGTLTAALVIHLDF